jgi:hypothetical protein
MSSIRPVNDDEVLFDLDRRMSGHGNGERTARELSAEPRHLRSIRSGTEPMTRKVARALGWELRWVRMEKPEREAGR